MANSPIPHPTGGDIEVVVEDAAAKQQHRRQHSMDKDAEKPTIGPASTVNKINAGDDDEMSVVGYVPSTCRQFLAILLVVCTAGMAALVFYWKKVN